MEDNGKRLTAEEAEQLRLVISDLVPRHRSGQTGLAEQIGLSQGQISRILKGHGSTIRTARLVAHELGVELDDLLHGTKRGERTSSSPPPVAPPSAPASPRAIAEHALIDEGRLLAEVARAVKQVDPTRPGADPASPTWWYLEIDRLIRSSRS